MFNCCECDIDNYSTAVITTRGCLSKLNFPLITQISAQIRVQKTEKDPGTVFVSQDNYFMLFDDLKTENICFKGN